MANCQLEPEPPPPAATSGSLYEYAPERTPEPEPFDNLSKGMTPKRINAMTKELQRLRETHAKFKENEPYIIFDSIQLSDDRKMEISKYPYAQSAFVFPPNQTRAFAPVSKGIECNVKIDLGLETSSHDRVSLIDKKLATSLIQCGGQIQPTKAPYTIKTSLGNAGSTTSNEMITLEIEFDKVKGKRCYLKCVITDLSNYDLIISYRDHVYLGLQDWLIEGKPLPTLEQGETEELENLLTPQVHHIGGEREKLPEKVTDVEFKAIVEKMDNDLPEKFKKELQELVMEYRDIFVVDASDFVAGAMDVPPYSATTTGTFYGVRRPMRQTGTKFEKLLEEIDKCVDQGVLIPSNASATSPAFVVFEPWKPQGKQYRLVVDYSVVNRIIARVPQNTIPKINDVLDFVAKFKWKGELDLKRSYWQFPIDDQTKRLLAISIGDDTYEPAAAPMGERNIPIVFQGERNRLFHDLRKNVRVFIDNDVVAADTPEELIETYRKVFEIARTKRMKYNIDAKLAVQSIKILGYEISVDEEGTPVKKIPTDQHQKFMDAPLPNTPGKMRSFLGLARVLAPFVPMLPRKLKDLNRLAHAGKEFNKKFTDEHRKLIQSIKESLRTIDGIHFYNPKYPVIAATDACNDGIGGVIYQVTDSGEHRILHWFAEPFQTPAKENWATNKKECYAINQLLNKNREFLLAVQPFVLLTDHANLTFLKDQTDGMMKRIQINISGFEIEFRYVPGLTNILPDKMSRVFTENKDAPTKWEKELQSYEAHALMRDPSARHSDFNITCDSVVLHEGKEKDVEVTPELSKMSPRRLKLLATYHGLFTGHHGWKQTCDLLQYHGHTWDGMEKDVKEYIKGCVICQKTRPLKDNRQLLERIHPLYEEPRAIGNTIEIDLCHMPQSTDGFNYVCVMVDIPSKFIFVHPQRDKDAITTACSLLQFIKNYGIPREIRSDNGPEFVNKVWDAFITLLRIERYTTAPYRSQAHGTVENANRQVITLLRSTLFVLGSETKKWHEHLPIVQFLLNRVIHEDTGLSSNDWVFGLRGPHMNKTVTQIDSDPIDFDKRHRRPTDKVLDSVPAATFFEEFERINKLLTHSIHSHLALYHKKKMKRLDKRNEGKNPFRAKKGQFVLIRDPTTAALDKLEPIRKGPWMVTDYDEIKGHYELKDISDDKIHERVDQEFVYPLFVHEQTVSYDDLIKYAALDREESLVTDILEHKYVKEGRKEELWLRTKYQDGTEWWNKWSDIRNTACAQWYVMTHSALEKHAKGLFKTMAERREKYSELKAHY